MSDERHTDWLEVLKQARDELRVKMHLGGLEAREEFERLDARMAEWAEKVKPPAERAAMVLDETAVQVAKDLKAGFQLLREAVKQQPDD